MNRKESKDRIMDMPRYEMFELESDKDELTFAELDRVLKLAKEKHGDKKDARLEFGSEYEGDYLYVHWESPETDEEYATRLKNLNEWRSARYQQYLLLKKEFEGELGT